MFFFEEKKTIDVMSEQNNFISSFQPLTVPMYFPLFCYLKHKCRAKQNTKPFMDFFAKAIVEVSLLNNTQCIKTSLTQVYFSVWPS